MNSYQIIGDVRGLGLFLGVELVEDRVSKEPSERAASWITRRCMELGVQVRRQRSEKW